ncbi:MAG: DUF11 domain-containing protein [Deltaproteobacteria bacterium]|nr:DUF11 domain-containing protein [Deltaproteobacteria bacterium]
MAKLIPAAAGLLLVLAGSAFARALDVSLDDRVDPVPAGSEMVYEIDLDVTSGVPAPDVLITLTLPPGTSFVSATREPDYAPIAGDVVGNEVRFDLGEEPSCNGKDIPACAAIWALVHVDGGVDPGTVLAATVVATSSDPDGFPTDTHSAHTSVGSLAIRKGRVNFSAAPGRDRIQFEADVGRVGWPSPNDPLRPTLDLGSGIRVRMGEAGGSPVVSVTVPADAFTCVGSAALRCRLADPKAWRPLGLDRLNVFFPLAFTQRNNASILVHSHNLELPDDIGPDMELTIDAAGETYTDTALHTASGRRLSYTHNQSKP